MTKKLDKLLKKPSPASAPSAAPASPTPKAETPAPSKDTKPQPEGDVNHELREGLTKTKEKTNGKPERRFNLLDPGSW